MCRCGRGGVCVCVRVYLCGCAMQEFVRDNLVVLLFICFAVNVFIVSKILILPQDMKNNKNTNISCNRFCHLFSIAYSFTPFDQFEMYILYSVLNCLNVSPPHFTSCVTSTNL